MKGCLKHSIVTPPPTRSPSPPMLAHLPEPEQEPVLLQPLAGSELAPPTISVAHQDEHDHDHPFCPHRKSVSFCSQAANEVFFADEWDRSPAEVTPRLTYKDMLELKEIQLSLPRAPQPSGDPDLPATDPSGAPRAHYLRTVPIALLPLLNSGAMSPLPSPRNLSFDTAAKPPSPGLTSPSKPTTPLPSPQPIAVSTKITHPPSPPSTPPPPPRLPYNFPPLPPSISNSRRFQPSIPQPTPSNKAAAWRGWEPPKPHVGLAPRARQAPKFNFLPLLETPTESPSEEQPKANETEVKEEAEEVVPISASNPESPTPSSSVSTDDSSSSSFSYFSIPLNSPQTPTPTSAPSTPNPPGSSSTSPSLSEPSLPATTSSSEAPSPDLLATRIAHVHLSALRSPALPPPSPFSLYAGSTPSDASGTSSKANFITMSKCIASAKYTPSELTLLRGAISRRSAGSETEEDSEVHTEGESDGEGFFVRGKALSKTGALAPGRVEVRGADAHDDEEEEGEMALVELESGVMAFVRVRR